MRGLHSVTAPRGTALAQPRECPGRAALILQNIRVVDGGAAMECGEGNNLVHRLFGPRARVLVLRGGYLGDFLAATPALRALRQALPTARIGLITSPALVPLARRYPWFDDIFTAPAWPGVSTGPSGEKVRRSFFEQMRAWQADIALQLNGGGESSNALVRQLGARLTVGARHPATAPDLDLTVPYLKPQAVRFRLLDVIGLLGIPATSIELELPGHPDDDRALAAALPEGLTPDTLTDWPLVGLHPGAHAGARRWPIERFAVVATAAWRQFGLRPVILGTETELGRALRQRITSAAQPIDLTGRTSLGALVALIRRLGVLIGNDSGPAHLAEAVGTPSVVIFGSGHPLDWGPPGQRVHRIVADWSAPCRGLRQCGCPDDSSACCLQAVSTGQVLEALGSLLEALRREACLQHLADDRLGRLGGR